MSEDQIVEYICISSDDEENESKSTHTGNNRKISTSTQQAGKTQKWEYTSVSTIHEENNRLSPQSDEHEGSNWKSPQLDESEGMWSEVFKSSSKDELAVPYKEAYDESYNESNDKTKFSSLERSAIQDVIMYLNSNDNENNSNSTKMTQNDRELTTSTNNNEVCNENFHTNNNENNINSNVQGIMIKESEAMLEIMQWISQEDNNGKRSLTKQTNKLNFFGFGKKLPFL